MIKNRHIVHTSVGRIDTFLKSYVKGKIRIMVFNDIEGVPAGIVKNAELVSDDPSHVAGSGVGLTFEAEFDLSKMDEIFRPTRYKVFLDQRIIQRGELTKAMRTIKWSNALIVRIHFTEDA